jgi:ADP-dependent NAD(P)H-hydrate dehydratase / NAD(P)H-hydrate epimerase
MITPLNTVDAAGSPSSPKDALEPVVNAAHERLRRVTLGPAWPLHSVTATRLVETARMPSLPPHTLMQRAGLAVARLALAVAPHARTVWVACGPGNNGGDGLEAAMHLQHWGKQVVVTWLGTAATAPADAALSYQRALDAGVQFADAPPARFELRIDALLGIGASSAARVPEGRMAQWMAAMNAGTAPVLAVDVPTGLNADTGHANATCVKAQFTLSLLTLKPGLFTGHGRDACGQVWLDDLGDWNDLGDLESPTAWLAAAPASPPRAHASHKGSYGDVAVVGGAPGMTGAALLAASAALQSGAGRVFVALLDGGAMAVDPQRPELMFRSWEALDFKAITLVCGCGGGDAVRQPISNLLSVVASVVIDADALNAIANDTQLQALLRARAARDAHTVLTPHPLEAARLLGTTAALVQQDRLAAARQLSERFMCTVVLKGSGTVIAAPNQTLLINPTGNAALATAGTGDVLAGMIGARLANAQRTGQSAFQSACDAVYLHGKAADDWPAHRTLTASDLASLTGCP